MCKFTVCFYRKNELIVFTDFAAKAYKGMWIWKTVVRKIQLYCIKYSTVITEIFFTL